MSKLGIQFSIVLVIVLTTGTVCYGFDVYRLVLPADSYAARNAALENWQSADDNTLFTLDPTALFKEIELRRAADTGVLQFNRVELSLDDLDGYGIDKRLQPLLKNRDAEAPEPTAVVDALAKALDAKAELDSGVPDGYTVQSWRNEILNRMKPHIELLVPAAAGDLSSVGDDVRGKMLEAIAKYAYVAAHYITVEREHAYRQAREFFAQPSQEEMTSYMIAGCYFTQSLEVYSEAQPPTDTETVEDMEYHICSCYYGLRQLSPTGHYLRLAEEFYGDFIIKRPSSFRAPRAAMMLAAFWTERAWDGVTDREKAVKQVERTLALIRQDSPPHVLSRLHLMAGELLYMEDREEEALDHLDKAIWHAQDDENELARRRTLVFAHYYALEACRTLGDNERCVPHAEYLVKNPPKSQEELFNTNFGNFLDYIEQRVKPFAEKQ